MWLHIAVPVLALSGLAIGCAASEATPPPCQLEETVGELTDESFRPDPGVHVVNTATCEIHDLEPKAYAFEITWAPSGDSFATVLSGAPPEQLPPGLYLISANTSEIRRLAGGLRPEKGSLGWSPDGEWVTFRQGRDLWVVRKDGSPLTNITPISAHGASSYVWSPQGEWLAFLLLERDSEDGRTYHHLTVADMTSEPPQIRTLITRTGWRDPQWMPDGQRLVERFLSEEPVVVVKAHDGGREPFTIPESRDVFIPQDAAPTWSPNGERAAVPCHNWLDAEETTLSPPQVCVTRADLSGARLVHPGDFQAWSPDSEYIALQWERQFYIVGAGDNNVQRVTNYPQRVRIPESRGGDGETFYPENLSTTSGISWASSAMVVIAVYRDFGGTGGGWPYWHLVARDGSWNIRAGPVPKTSVSPDGKWIGVHSVEFQGSPL